MRHKLPLLVGCIGFLFFAFLLIAICLPVMAIAADEPAETIRLWVSDAPGSLGSAPQDIPLLAWWPTAIGMAIKKPATETSTSPDTPVATTRPPASAVVICPGGGYGALADHEGTDYAKWLNAQGISAFVLRYRLGSKGYRHPVMLGDVSRAMRLVRHEHKRLNIDPQRLAIMGSSAGGHLALTLLTHGDDGDPLATDPVDRQPSQATLGILCYPVVSMLPDNTHGGSRKNLLGDNPSEELVRELSGELAANEKMPPVFMWHTVADKAVKLEPILALASRLKILNRPFALHVYETGDHGLGLGVRPYDASKTVHPWAGECVTWLTAHGFSPIAH